MNLRFHAAAIVLSLGLGFASAADPGKPGEAITEPKQALAGIPRDVLQDMRPGSRKMEDAALKATDVVRKNVEGKTGTFKFTVGSIEKYQPKETPDVNLYRIKATSEMIRESGAAFTYFLLVVPDVKENEKVAKINKGSKVTFTGRISNGEILPRKSAELHIEIMEAKIK